MIIADTGFCVALLFRRDSHHALAAEAYPHFKGELITAWPIPVSYTHLTLPTS